MSDKNKKNTPPKKTTRLRVDWDFIDRAMPSGPALADQRRELAADDKKLAKKPATSRPKKTTSSPRSEIERLREAAAAGDIAALVGPAPSLKSLFDEILVETKGKASRKKGRVFKYRVEPYDPDAVDADNDGIVQEGTIWERPAGLRIVDKLGKEITKGITAGLHPDDLRYIDADGNRVEYHVPPPGPKQLGTTIGEMSRTVGQLVTAPVKRGRIGVDPNDRVEFEDEKTRERFGPLVNLLAQIHGAHPRKPTGIDGTYSRELRPDDQVGESLSEEPEVRALSQDRPLLTRIIRREAIGTAGQRALGGIFSPAGTTTVGPDGTTLIYDPRPVIEAKMIAKLGPDSDLTGFLHEFGHFLDVEYDGSVGDGIFSFGAAVANDDPEAKALIEAAMAQPSFDAIAKYFFDNMPDEWAYWISTHEIWARLYAQWAAFRLRDDRPDVYKQAMFEIKKTPEVGWTEAEFATLIPLIEDFLRVRGLLT